MPLSASEITATQVFLAASWPGVHQNSGPGWEARSAEGYTRRANSVWIFDPQRCPPSSLQRQAWEAWYAAQGLPALVMIPETTELRAWDAHLQAAKYRLEEPSRVMRISLSGSHPVATDLHPEWSGPPFIGLEAAAAAIVQATQPASQRVCLGPAGVPGIAQALMYVQGPLAAVAGVEVRPDFRGLGWGRRLMQVVLDQARRQGAQTLILQVRAANAPALNLYTSLGFSDCYGYHYRKQAL